MSATEAGSATEPASRLLDDAELTDDARIWLVRHGETEWSASGQHTGSTDLPLTAAGEEQARAVSEVLGDLGDSYVVCSPLQRARRTADLAGLQLDEIDTELAEWDYGEYEGLTSAQIRESRPDWSIWNDGAPGGESPEQVAERADRVLRRVTPHLGRRTVVLVGHGHFSRALGARWLGLPITAGGALLLGTAAPCLLGAQYGVPAITHWNLPNPRG